MNRRHAILQLSLGATGLAFSSAFLSALTSCEASKETGYQPVSFSAEQDELLQELTELIIPTTETPGAKAAGVSQYIDRVLAQVADSEEKETFLEGLKKLEMDDFLALSVKEQVGQLAQLEAKNDPFFQLLKSMTLYGYYTSEIGATQELTYVHAAGRYDGDVAYSEVGKNYF